MEGDPPLLARTVMPCPAKPHSTPDQPPAFAPSPSLNRAPHVLYGMGGEGRTRGDSVRWGLPAHPEPLGALGFPGGSTPTRTPTVAEGVGACGVGACLGSGIPRRCGKAPNCFSSAATSEFNTFKFAPEIEEAPKGGRFSRRGCLCLADFVLALQGYWGVGYSCGEVMSTCLPCGWYTSGTYQDRDLTSAARV